MSILPEELKTSTMPCDICVCSNNKTGKYFIVIDSTQETVMTLVTPAYKILQLQSSLFSESEYMDENILLQTGLLHENQIAAYYRYIEDYEKECVPQTGLNQSGVEPEYVRTYRNMLSNYNSMPSTMHRIVEERKHIKWYELVEQLTKHGYVGTGGSLTASLKVLEIDGYLQVEGAGNGKSISYIRAIERTGTNKTSHKKLNELDKLLKRMTEEQKALFLVRSKQLL